MDSLTLTITFQSSEELQDFLKQLKPKEKKLKKENDRRGSQTKTLHILAKEYKEENKEIPYKHCLKIAGEKIKNKD
jgi:hypothetical protein